MPKFPEPPTIHDLRRLGADVVVLSSGTWIWRIYFRDPPGRGGWNVFRSFGPLPASRFDHHLPPTRIQERQIMYAARDPLTCFAEVFQRERRIHRRLNSPALAGIATERELRLVNLAGPWPTAAGASMAINSGDRKLAQEWSRAIYDAFPDVDGLWYSSSMNANAPSFALYERAENAMPEMPIFNRPLTDPSLATTMHAAALQFGYDLV